MANRLGIEMLTLLGMPPVEHVELAAELGCVSISTGLMKLPLAPFGYPDVELYPDWSLVDDTALRRETKAALRDTGVHIGLGEGFRVCPEQDVVDAAGQLDVMADLGVWRINAICTEHDLPRAHDQYAMLAEMVTVRGMQFMVEFAPPHAVNSVGDALAVVEHVGRGRCRLMFDSMHFFRSGGTLEDIAELDPTLIGYAQMCDAPAQSPGSSYMQEAMFERMVPGEGELPLRDWVAALPLDCAIGLEVPMIERFRSGMTPREHAAGVVAAARALGA
ncbi:MAG: TIM barrel protein [Novosphingobium sp.]|nr:TIM barrel protein [Novosphingobium sp.]MCP5403908.1 TIM barrel protein [Novosphingobium sp.]